MEQWLLVLSATAAVVAAVTGIWLVVWGWIDRPQLGWNFHIKRDPFRGVDRDDGRDVVLADRSESDKVALAIKPLGTARMVEIRFSGCRVLNVSDPTYMPEWMPGSDSLKFEVMLPGGMKASHPTWRSGGSICAHGATSGSG
jgi:hypothetical protein